MKREIKLMSKRELQDKFFRGDILSKIEWFHMNEVHYETDSFREALQQAYNQGYEDAESAQGSVKKALKDLIQDLEQRSTWKEGRDKGVVDCGHGVYMQAKRALGDFK